jgi:hypothetical protein
MARCIARDTLEKARYFLAQAMTAEAAPQSPSMAFVAHLEAAIVYGHAIRDHLSAEFSRRPKWRLWKAARLKVLRVEPLFLFFSAEGDRATDPGLRQIILHRGGEQFSLFRSVQLFMQIMNKASVSKVVIRAAPWYRRSPRIIFDDLIYPARERWRTWRSERQVRQEAAERFGGDGRIERTFFFTASDWKHEPARIIVGKFLDLMESEIDDAEANL